MLEIIKIVFFTIHIFIILGIVIFPWIYPHSILLQILVIFSWKFNSNKCLLTQLEYYIFKETIINYYYKYGIGKKLLQNTYIVPKKHRYIMYTIFSTYLTIFIYNIFFDKLVYY